MKSTILIKPIITERSIEQTKKGFYTFVVGILARKGIIKKTIEDQFGVDVIAIRTIKMPEKSRRIGKNMNKTKTPFWKKAIVKLGKEQKIPIFDVGN